MTSANMAKESGATTCVEGENITSNKNSKLVEWNKGGMNRP